MVNVATNIVIMDNAMNGTAIISHENTSNVTMDHADLGNVALQT